MFGKFSVKNKISIHLRVISHLHSRWVFHIDHYHVIRPMAVSKLLEMLWMRDNGSHCEGNGF